MYSHEIKQFIENKGNDISSEDYRVIVETSPQINYMEWVFCVNKMKICTTDGYEFLTAMHPPEHSESH